MAPDMETKKFNYRAIILVFLVVAILVIVFVLKQNNPYLKYYTARARWKNGQSLRPPGACRSGEYLGHLVPALCR